MSLLSIGCGEAQTPPKPQSIPPKGVRQQGVTPGLCVELDEALGTAPCHHGVHTQGAEPPAHAMVPRDSLWQGKPPRTALAVSDHSWVLLSCARTPLCSQIRSPGSPALAHCGAFSATCLGVPSPGSERLWGQQCLWGQILLPPGQAWDSIAAAPVHPSAPCPLCGASSPLRGASPLCGASPVPPEAGELPWCRRASPGAAAPLLPRLSSALTLVLLPSHA